MDNDKPLKKFEARALARIRARAGRKATAPGTQSTEEKAWSDERIEALSQRVRQLEQEVKMCCGKLEKTKKSAGLLRKDSLYIVVLGVFVIAVLLLVVYGWAQKPTVAINFDVGNIIGGVLVGIAALVASLTYSRKERDRGGVPPEDQDKG